MLTDASSEREFTQRLDLWRWGIGPLTQPEMDALDRWCANRGINKYELSRDQMRANGLVMTSRQPHFFGVDRPAGQLKGIRLDPSAPLSEATMRAAMRPRRFSALSGLGPERTVFIPPRDFAYFVEAGIIDENGNFP